MQHQPGPHFASSAAALRFYFRACEILATNRREKSPATIVVDARAAVLTRAFASVGLTVEALQPVERFILGELYGLTCFGEPHRTVARACEVARKRFPLIDWTPHLVSQMRRITLARLDSELALRGLLARRPPHHSRCLSPSRYLANSTQQSLA